MDDGEYEGGTLAQLLAAALGSEAEGKVDLLTVVMHEMGHALRLDDVPTSQSTRLMTEMIRLGERRLPSAADVPDATKPATPQGDTGTPPTTITLSPSPRPISSACSKFRT